ncbi:Do/DeqQ family serine protease [Balneicella halophila]|uniref:Do/DeqQ family serine protease n=1 Tax=Balneicella halophila TaxID=1537566 RepID=A0A7L4UNE2_BALHA|nr:Do/DeqQ family serine protease [Balneicella halophila]
MIVLIALGAGGIFMYLYLNWENKLKTKSDTDITYSQPQTQGQASVAIAGQPVDLRTAASTAVKSVVHVKTQYTQRAQYRNPFLEFFYGQGAGAPTRQVMQSGSGVIISDDGYIVTNNHVIERSDKIVVVLNDQREFPAELVGRDPNTDLALLKIKGKDLPAIEFANSDKVALGEWVLAVGNPYNLTSTVTAGIVSAKGRSISDPRKRKMSLDAFIQTDAVVNPGNSGGALVNTAGQLVGINTAIQSTTGSYVGYSFAIPSNVAAKVANDLKEYGSVQRGYLGVQIAPMTTGLAKQFNSNKVEGVFVAEVTKGGAAEEAGVQAEDIIISINKIKVNSVEQLQEQLAKYSPSDDLTISAKRKGIVKHFDIELRNTIGEGSLQQEIILGAYLKPLNNEMQKVLRINSGVIVTQLGVGKLQQAGVREGFVILNINNTVIKTTADVQKALDDNVLNGKFLVEGIYPNGEKAYYRFLKD